MSSQPYKTKGRVNYHVAKDYKLFCILHPEVQITKQQHYDIIFNSNKLIAEAILENPFGFKLPNGLGYIAIDKYKPKPNKSGKTKKAIDWVNTNKFKKLIYLTNLHSFGWIYRIRLYKSPHAPNLDCYTFKAQRLLKRALAVKIKEGKQYHHIDRSYFSRRFSIDKIFKNNK